MKQNTIIVVNMYAKLSKSSKEIKFSVPNEFVLKCMSRLNFKGTVERFLLDYRSEVEGKKIYNWALLDKII